MCIRDRNINGPEDLAGKTIGYSGTELSEAMIRTMMETAGVPADSVTLVDAVSYTHLDVYKRQVWYRRTETEIPCTTLLR